MTRTPSILHDEIIVCDGHNHFMIGLDPIRTIGKKGVFSSEYAPRFKAGGVNVVTAIVGADTPSCCAFSDNLQWGTFRVLNSILHESEESSDTMKVCTTHQEIMETVEAGKIACILGIEGGRPLEGKSNYDSLDILEIFYKLGLRQVQLCDFGRNRLGDGLSTAETHGGLTPFGKNIIRRMNQLGMIVDTAHMNDEGFWDTVKVCDGPVIDSHSGVRAVCDTYSQNISDERLKALAETGGVLGVSVYDLAMISREKIEAGIRPTADDFVNHVEYVIDKVGIDHVAMGSDHFPDHGFYPLPGWCEGTVYIGERDSYYIEDIKEDDGFGLLTEALMRRGYKEEEIAKIMGGNLLRIYKEVLK